MIRFIKYLLCCAAVGAAVILAMRYYFAQEQLFAEKTSSKSLADFDFSSYSFGIVAVALAFAGVYISLVQERFSDQVMKLVTLHFIPHVFGDINILKNTCHPDQAIIGVERIDSVRCLHALDQLSRWNLLEDNEIREFLGPNGLGAKHNQLNFGFKLFQHQIDRVLIASLGIVISIIYMIAPLAYWSDSERFAAAMLFTVWLLSVIEMLVCLGMYLTRNILISRFEAQFPKWNRELKLFLFTKQMNRVPDVTTLQV